MEPQNKMENKENSHFFALLCFGLRMTNMTFAYRLLIRSSHKAHPKIMLSSYVPRRREIKRDLVNTKHGS